ncbi:MAG: T9SS type A sorting domain-containing protein [Segetibacter sp.]
MIKVLQPCLLVLFTGTTLSGFSQEKSQWVIASGGDVSKVGNVILEWTVGEPAVETVSSSNSLYTQGFHQPQLEVKRINYANSNVVKNVFHVFPNPATSVLNIFLDNAVKEQLLVSLVDVSGRGLLNTTFPQETTAFKLDVSRFTSGAYFLRITNKDGSIHSEFKVIKAK